MPQHGLLFFLHPFLATATSAVGRMNHQLPTGHRCGPLSCPYQLPLAPCLTSYGALDAQSNPP